MPKWLGSNLNICPEIRDKPEHCRKTRHHQQMGDTCSHDDDDKCRFRIIVRSGSTMLWEPDCRGQFARIRCIRVNSGVLLDTAVFRPQQTYIECT